MEIIHRSTSKLGNYIKYDLRTVRDSKQSQLCATRMKFIIKHYKMFSFVKIQLDHKIHSLQSIRAQNIGNFYKELIIYESSKKKSLYEAIIMNKLSYDEIKEGINQISKKIQMMHKFGFYYGNLNENYIYDDFELRIPPIIYDKIPGNVDMRAKDIFDLGRLIYILSNDGRTNFNISDGTILGNTPDLILEMMSENPPLLNNELIDRINKYFEHREGIMKS